MASIADAIGFVISEEISKSAQRQFLYVAPSDKAADAVQKQIEFFAQSQIENNQLEILNFPAWDCLPYDRVSPKQSIVSARVNCLHKLAKKFPAGADRRVYWAERWLNFVVQIYPHSFQAQKKLMIAKNYNWI